MMWLLRWISNVVFASISAVGLTMVIYVAIHKDGTARQAITAFCILGLGVGTLITSNSKDE